MADFYNPFNKPLDKITEKDLEILKKVKEGWFVEYKKEKQSGTKIAKSISSFANSYGGYYFIGIEQDDRNNCAKEILGVDDNSDIVRDSVRGNIQPFPYFETHVIELANEKHVIMVYVYEGDQPPYVHSSGRIYRRQEAGSDPIKAETDRHAIDQLYAKSENHRASLEEFRNLEYSMCKAENFPHLIVYINTFPFQTNTIGSFTNVKNIEELLSNMNKRSKIEEVINGNEFTLFEGNIEFDTVNTYSKSVSLRQMKGKSLAYNGLTLEIDIYGNLKLLLPLEIIAYHTYEFNANYFNVFQDYEPENITIINAKKMFLPLPIILSNYCEYLIMRGYDGALQTNLELMNCWRTTLYINSDQFNEYLAKYGLPVCMKENQLFPTRPIKANVVDVLDSIIQQSFTIYGSIALALGIPFDVATNSITEEIWNLKN